MKAMILKAACFAATSMIAAQAWAATVNVNPAVTVNASGASALRLSFGNAVGDICDTAAAAPNRPIEFRNSATGTSHRAYMCSVRTGAIAGLAAGTRVLVYKRDAGGSIQGVFPVARSLSIARMNLGAAPFSFDDVTGAGLQAGCTLGGFTPQVTNAVAVICAGTTNAVPDAGLSDVEPDLFKGANKENAADPDWGKAPGDATVLVDRQVGAQAFGIAVSKNLYDELQTAQGLVQADDLPGANQPNLNVGQITGMLKGDVQSWSDLYSTILGPVKVCRRVPGSGTQATSNAFFLQNPCLESAANPATNLTDGFAGNNTAATAGSTAPAGGAYMVVMNSGSGDVVNCLNAANAQNERAFGWLSFENRVAATDNWRYVKLNGVSGNHDVDADSPTAGLQAENFTDNVVNGQYQAVFEFVTLRRNLSANQNALWDGLVTRLQNPANLYRSTAADQDFLPGLAAHVLSGFLPAPSGTDQPVMRASRGGDSCQGLTSFLPVNPTGGE